jgi:hypothetical protein
LRKSNFDGKIYLKQSRGAQRPGFVKTPDVRRGLNPSKLAATFPLGYFLQALFKHRALVGADALYVGGQKQVQLFVHIDFGGVLFKEFYKHAFYTAAHRIAVVDAVVFYNAPQNFLAGGRLVGGKKVGQNQKGGAFGSAGVGRMLKNGASYGGRVGYGPGTLRGSALVKYLQHHFAQGLGDSFVVYKLVLARRRQKVPHADGGLIIEIQKAFHRFCQNFAVYQKIGLDKPFKKQHKL